MLTRRNPLVVLLCLELMLNAGNLALIAFSRMWGNGDGQVFALIVMVVAACEVVVGLGLIVAMYRRRAPDRRRRALGAARDERHRPAAGWSWPSRSPGCIVDLARLARPAAGARAGWIGSARDRRCRSLAAIGALISLQDQAPEERHLTSTLCDYVAHRRRRRGASAILVDPLSVFMCLVVTGVSSLIHLYSVAYMDSDRGYARYFAYLNFFVFSMLLLVLAGNFVLLIVGWAFVGAASYLLISFWYRRETATAAGIKAFVMNVIGDVGLVIGRVPAVRGDRRARLRRRLRAARTRSSPRTTARSWPPACCSWSARSRSPRSCRCTPGSRTRWRARRRSPR